MMISNLQLSDAKTASLLLILHCSTEAGQGALPQIPSFQASDSQGNSTLSLVRFHQRNENFKRPHTRHYMFQHRRHMCPFDPQFLGPRASHNPTCTEDPGRSAHPVTTGKQTEYVSRLVTCYFGCSKGFAGMYLLFLVMEIFWLIRCQIRLLASNCLSCCYRLISPARP